MIRVNTSRRIELIAGAAATLALVACSTPTENLSIAVTQIQRFEPPEEYRSLWETVEACSSMSNDFELVRWYEAQGIVIQGDVVLGFWEAPHDITILSNAKENDFVVRHEMLHDLLSGDPDHQHEAWSQCGLGNNGTVDIP
jgi:hypothetical protein